MGADDPVQALYREPDQEAVRRDLSILFGPSNDYYLKEYEEMRQFWAEGEMPRPSWNWSAFLAGPAWMFYRRLYGFGGAIFAFALLSELLFRSFPSELLAGVASAAASNAAYVNQALRHIAKANTLNLQGEERVAYLRRVGGVSLSSAFAVGVLTLALVAAPLLH